MFKNASIDGNLFASVVVFFFGFTTPCFKSEGCAGIHYIYREENCEIILFRVQVVLQWPARGCTAETTVEYARKGFRNNASTADNHFRDRNNPNATGRTTISFGPPVA
jgi:hypothetical protein